MSKLHHLLPAPLFTLQDAATSGITRNQVVRGGTTRIALQVYALEGYSPPSEELLKLIHAPRHKPSSGQSRQLGCSA